MGMGVSIILALVGAVILWGVDATIGGVDFDLVGLILLIVGIVGALLSLMFWSTWGGGLGRRHDDRVVVERRGRPPIGL